MELAHRDREKKWLDSLGTSEIPALGFIEVSSIARGLWLTDLIVKKAPVRIIASQPVSSGKHVVLFSGDVASVEASYRDAVENAGEFLIKETFIPGVHEGLVPFLDSLWETQPTIYTPQESVGIVESHTLAAAVIAADRALKCADVKICRLRLGQGIGGKAYFVLSGTQEQVEAALETSQLTLKELESFCRVDLIARPQSDVLEFF